MSKITTKSEFGKWRSLLWPIHNYELKKLLPMLLLFFLILFNYTVLRDTKDTLIITAPGSGAETLTFVKFWGVLPMAVIFMIIYAKLSNVLSKTALFYATVTPFLIFFALFALVLYPLRDSIHPHAFCDRLQETLPQGLTGLIAVIRNWSFSLFYIMAELWGSMILSLCFWAFANDTTKVTESKRFYNLFGMGANFSLILSGFAIIGASNIRSRVTAGTDPWQISLYFLMSFVIVSGILVMVTYWWINKYVLSDPRFYASGDQKKMKKDKPKMSLKDSFLFLIRSKYIGLIAVLVITYGISTNIVEVTWKSQLKLYFTNPNDYNTFMGRFSLTSGITTIFMMLFVGGNVIRRFGWGIGAMVTPIVLFITGAAFFGFVLFRDSLGPYIALMGTSPLFLAVIFGMVQNILSKSCKYSLFDPTKEMAYIPLDQESKIKGKAAVDVVAARLGKAGGAVMQQGLIIGFGSIAAITPYLGAILLVFIVAWLWGARRLNKRFLHVSAEKEKERLKEIQDEEDMALEKSSEPIPAK